MLVPQSPRTNWPSHETYCSATGRSSPSDRRWAATCSADAAGPTSSRAGSPGARRSRANISVTTPSTTPRPLSARRASESMGAISAGPEPRASGSGRGRRGSDTFRRASPPPPAARRARRARRLPAGGGTPRGHRAVRLRRRSPEHEPARHPASARAAGAALRAAHDARALRLGARARAVPGASLDVVAGPADADASSAVGRALERRRSHDVARRALDARRSAGPGGRLPTGGRARRARAGRRTGRLDGGPALRRAAAALPRCPHRSRHSPGAPAGHRAARRAPPGGLERGAGRQRSVPLRGARAQPPVGLRGQPGISPRAGRAAAARAPHHRRGRRAGHQARRAHGGRARLRGDPAGACELRGPRSGARGPELSAAPHLRDRIQHSPGSRSTT